MASYNDILSINGLNTLTFNDPYAKLCFTAMLASYYQRTIYIDLDTMFTGYLKAGLLSKNLKAANNTINIYLPSEGRFESILREVIDSMSDSSIVIFDSVNSFYNMYYKKINIESGQGMSKLNHILSIFLMILVRYGAYLGVPVLVTSMYRYKKGKEWVQSPASKRLLQKKSIVSLDVEMLGEKDLFVKVIRHPRLNAETIIFTNKGINF
jgi:hypothetical protein